MSSFSDILTGSRDIPLLDYASFLKSLPSSSTHPRSSQYLTSNPWITEDHKNRLVNDKTGYKLNLYEAAHAGHLARIIWLVEYNGARINKPDERGYTALHYAALSSALPSVVYLIERGAMIDRQTPNQDTALSLAQHAKHTEVIRYLAAQCSLKAAKVNDWETVFQYLCDAKLTSLLNLNATDVAGCTLLYWAIFFERSDAVKRLLEYEAPLDQSNQAGETPLTLLLKKPRFLRELLLQRSERLLLRIEDHTLLPDLLRIAKITATEMKLILKNSLQYPALHTALTHAYLLTWVRTEEHSDQSSLSQVAPAQQLQQQIADMTVENPFVEALSSLRILMTHHSSQSLRKLKTILDDCEFTPTRMINLPTTKEAICFAVSAQQENVLFNKINKVLADIDQFLNTSDVEEEVKRLLNIITREYRQYLSESTQAIQTFHQKDASPETVDFLNMRSVLNGAYTVDSKTLHHRYLKQAAAVHLTPVEGEEQVQRENQYGTHILRQWQGIHFKYHDERQPCYPAIEYMISSLYSTVAREVYGIAPTELIKLQRGQDYSQILMASLNVEGINLVEFLTEYAFHYPAYLQLFEPQNFSALFVTCLLSNPADAKPDNFIIQLINKEENIIDLQKKSNPFQIRIVGIDNDLAFTPPIIQKETGARQGQHLIGLKCVFYFFPQMHQALQPVIRDHLLARPALDLLIDWLELLENQAKAYTELWQRHVLTVPEWRLLQLPICFRANTLKGMYYDVLRLQAYLQSHETATHHQLLAHLRPTVAQYYEWITRKYAENENPVDRIMHSLEEFYTGVRPTLEETLKPDWARELDPLNHAEKPNIPESTSLNRDQDLAGAITELLGSVNWRTHLSSNELPKTLLRLATFERLQHLMFNQHSALDDDLLSHFLTQLTHLKTLHCIKVPAITVEGVTSACMLTPRKINLGLLKCEQIDLTSYKILEKHPSINLHLLYKNPQKNYVAFKWHCEKVNEILVDIIKANIIPSGSQLLFLLTYMVNINTVLHKIFAENIPLSESALDFLLKQGADINSYYVENKDTSYYGYTALHMATKWKNTPRVQQLLDHGANPFLTDMKKNQTAYQKAEKYKFEKVCLLLKEAENNPSQYTPKIFSNSPPNVERLNPSKNITNRDNAM